MSEDKKRLALPDLFGEKNKTIETLKAEKCELERKIGDMEAEKHSRLLAEIIQMKLEACSIKGVEVEAEIKRLSQIPDQALIIIKDDWKRAINKLATRKKLYR